MIWLHLGLHKTGTTSIQGALRLITHRPGLSIWTIGDSPPALTPAWATWVATHAARGDVVVSDESLLGDPVAGYPLLKERLAALRAVLPAEGLTVVVSVRRQYEWIQSVYLQSLQQGSTWTPEAFWGQLRPSPFMQWSTLLGEIESAFAPAPVRILIHHSARDAVGEFFSECGLALPTGNHHSVRDNVSISAAQAPIVRRLNASRSHDEAAHLRSFMQLIAPAPQTRPMSALPERIQEQIAHEYAADWNHLTRDDPSVAWSPSSVPFAGDDLGNPVVEEEVLRLLGLAIDRAQVPGSRSRVHRALAKVRSNPRDVPAAISRALQRRP